jgi:hypothetical protein
MQSFGITSKAMRPGVDTYGIEVQSDGNRQTRSFYWANRPVPEAAGLLLMRQLPQGL